MNPEQQLAAAMIANTSTSLAGFAASEMSGSQDPTADSADSFSIWKSHLEQRLRELRAALTLGEPRLLEHDVCWSRVGFEKRGLDPADLERTLTVLQEVVREKLPPPASTAANDYLEQAREALVSGRSPENVAPLERGDLVDAYLGAVKRGDRAAATKVVLDAFAEDTDALELYEQVLIPAQRRIGELWHAGTMSIAEEHFCTATTQRTMTVLAHEAMRRVGEPAMSTGTMVAAACRDNAHDIPLRVLSDFFEINGWRTILLGQDVPPEDLAIGVHAFEADVLLISATLSVHLPTVKEAIEVVRGALQRDCKILVGGRAFAHAEDLWQKVGADAHATSARDALSVASELMVSSAVS